MFITKITTLFKRSILGYRQQKITIAIICPLNSGDHIMSTGNPAIIAAGAAGQQKNPMTAIVSMLGFAVGLAGYALYFAVKDVGAKALNKATNFVSSLWRQPVQIERTSSKEPAHSPRMLRSS